MSGGYPDGYTYQPWQPRHVVVRWHGKNDYSGTPFSRFRPAPGMAQPIANECAIKVNSMIKRIMWRARTGRI